MQETWVWSLGWEDPLEEGMATHSSILAWRIPYGQRSLEGYSPWGLKESDTIEQLSTAQTTWIRVKDQSQPFSRTKMKFLCSTINTSQHRNDCLTLTVLEPENISSSTTLRKLKSYTHVRERLLRTVMSRTLTMGCIGRHDFFLQLTLSVSCLQTLTHSTVTGRKILNFLGVFVYRSGCCPHPSPLPSRSGVLAGVPGTLFTEEKWELVSSMIEPRRWCMGTQGIIFTFFWKLENFQSNILVGMVKPETGKYLPYTVQ